MVAEYLLRDPVDAEHTGHLALRTMTERVHAAAERAAAAASRAAPPSPPRLPPGWPYRRAPAFPVAPVRPRPRRHASSGCRCAAPGLVRAAALEDEDLVASGPAGAGTSSGLVKQRVRAVFGTTPDHGSST
ncbi:hypothetical protein GCM10010421_22450 [Streptomyces glaucus]|uniref:Uncharacterized protein n=1 Tax=Streptomyces glaucus TaxID=284029 RepID=A0ABN3JL78_9ACTN